MKSVLNISDHVRSTMEGVSDSVWRGRVRPVLILLGGGHVLSWSCPEEKGVGSPGQGD